MNKIIKNLTSWFGIPRYRVAIGLNKDSCSFVVYSLTTEGCNVGKTKTFNFQSKNNIYVEFEHELSAFVKENHLNKAACDIVLNSDWYRLFLQVIPPQINKAEAGNFLRFQVKDLVDIPVEDISVEELFINGEYGQEKKEYVVVTDRKVMQRLANCIGNSELNLISANIREYIMASTGNSERKNTCVQIALDNDDCTLVIAKNGKICFTRNFFMSEHEEYFLIEEIRKSLNIGSSLLKEEIKSLDIFPNTIFTNIQWLKISQELGYEARFIDLLKDVNFKKHVKIFSEVDYKPHWTALGMVYQLAIQEMGKVK